MTFWKKLTNWEKKLEQGPKIEVLRLGILVLSLSIVVSFTISQSLILVKVKAQEKILTDIRFSEQKRMDARLEELKELRYEQTR